MTTLKPFLARLIQNGFTGEAKAGEARKTGFFWLLVYFNPGLQNDFTLQCLDLRKIDEAEAGISRAKDARIGGENEDIPKQQKETTEFERLGENWN